MGPATVEKKSLKMQHSCRQCGTCCTKGGAALHSGDIDLLREDKIPRRDLVTLRRGEFAWSPVTENLEAIQSDIIKLRGVAGEWTCCYFDALAKCCTIYHKRPLACRVLKCWQPEESLALAGNDLLSRQTILHNETELLALVEQYEHDFALPDFSLLAADLDALGETTRVSLEEMVNRDLGFRDTQVQLSAKIAAEELFLFGRPLFQLLQPFGLDVFQSGNRLRLQKRAG